MDLDLNKRDFEVINIEKKEAFNFNPPNQRLFKRSRFSWGYEKHKLGYYRNFGRIWAFCFWDSEPIITIGPHCNFSFYL